MGTISKPFLLKIMLWFTFIISFNIVFGNSICKDKCNKHKGALKNTDGSKCYCDDPCWLKYNDCCDGFHPECRSAVPICVDKCGSAGKFTSRTGAKCFCNESCKTQGNCCDDFQEACDVEVVVAVQGKKSNSEKSKTNNENTEKEKAKDLLHDILLDNQWTTEEKAAKMTEEEKRKIVIKKLSELANNAEFFQSLSNEQLLVISKIMKGTASSKESYQASNPYPYMFPNPHPWQAEEKLDADKQVNMYYVNNVDIHA